MKFSLRGVSSAAILAGLASALPAWAQAPQPVEQIGQAAPSTTSDEPATSDRVVITGSLIAGTREDQALPVTVFSTEELEEQGAPSALEFAKSLTVSGPTQGEANYHGGSASGNVGYNLRGIGSDKTLMLMNGRRFNDNASMIPAAALARTELLKDGAAVTYGADAVGGVVNFITLDNYTGLEGKVGYKYIDGSDGDYNASILGGYGEGDLNVLWSVEYEHRSPLRYLDRDWASLPFAVNPAPWSTLTNIATFTPRGPLPPGPFIPPPSGQFTLAQEFGPALGAGIRDGNPAQCAAIGGAGPLCNYGYGPYYNLVEDTDTYRAYLQANGAVSEYMNFHAEALYGQLKTVQTISPGLPSSRGPALAVGDAEFFIPVTNPFVSQFMTDKGYAGSPNLAGFTLASASNGYRPFAHNGTTAFGADQIIRNFDGQYWRASVGVDGHFGDSFGFLNDVNYDVALTYNQQLIARTLPDTLGFRMQEALNGFGGPNCSAQDLNPNRFGIQNPAAAGKNGCQWYNPFVTNFVNQPVLGLTNPESGTVRGLPVPAGATSWENSQALQRWLFDDGYVEDINTRLTLDAVLSGRLPVSLPGGNVGWALGFQAQQLEARSVVPSEFNNGATPCAWPGQLPAAPGTPNYTGCTLDRPGPYFFQSPDIPENQDQQSTSFFGEMQLPVLDNFNLAVAVRNEEFSRGLGDTVYKVSGKWDVWGPLSLRASYGTNFQAPPLSLRPGFIQNGQSSYTIAGQFLPAVTETRTDVVPATATSWNAGVIWQSAGFASDHDFRLIVDYFDIETENEFRTLATHNQVANAVWNSANRCAHPLISRIIILVTPETPNGTCTANMTIASFGGARTEFGNGPGVLTSGIDFQADYTLPIGDGDLAIGVSGTQVLKLEDTATTLDGFLITASDDRLGFLNFSGAGVAAPEFRVNTYLNYGLGPHNIRLMLGYVSAVSDDRPGIQYGETGEDWYGLDLHYTFDVTDTLRLFASIVNLEDRDPPGHQIEQSYDPRIASALGRTFELSIKKTF